MSITRQNIHKHEFIGLDIEVVDSADKGMIGLKGRIVDETKNTFRIDISGKEKTLQKKATVLAIKIGDSKVNINASKLRFRPEDRIKKAKRRAVS